MPSNAQDDMVRFYSKHGRDPTTPEPLGSILDRVTGGAWSNMEGVDSRATLCRHCKVGTTVILGKQTRSADEGMTMFSVCSVCSKTEKVDG